ncbi:MAG: LLM class flavin-dependent oxidoreductase, partial [Segniliparus sp.]|uniref:LLM class flavin-dependent oxidoreductase n=1 Tax=Segniliparus sp. TaxID=2804064 RepID=UPI003F33B8CB
ADIARTIDHISGGRHILGLGAGWYQPDYDEYGYEFGTFTTRFKLFEEGLERIVARFAKLNPAPTRHIPILIGGTGEKKTLPLVAKYADIWHSFGDIPSLERRKDILGGLLEQNGRPADAVEISQEWPGIERADEYVAAGVTFFNISLFNPVEAPFVNVDDDLSLVKEALAWRDKANG